MSGGHESGFKYCSIYAKLGHIDSFEGPLLLTLNSFKLQNKEIANIKMLAQIMRLKILKISVFEARQMLSKCLVFQKFEAGMLINYMLIK